LSSVAEASKAFADRFELRPELYSLGRESLQVAYGETGTNELT
jgi:hypothetical protein